LKKAAWVFAIRLIRSERKFMKFKTLIGLSIYALSHWAMAQSVDFIEPKDGAVLSSPFKVAFAVSGMEVAPAGELKPNAGHHHLLINAEGIPEGAAIPFDDAHKHFGKGQTETEVTLPPGKYKLTMQFANGAHQSYGPKLSKTIEVTVK
jgi:hypothetical protein